MGSIALLDPSSELLGYFHQAPTGLTSTPRMTTKHMLQPGELEFVNRIVHEYHAKLRVAKKGVYSSIEYVSPTFKEHGPPCLSS